MAKDQKARMGVNFNFLVTYISKNPGTMTDRTLQGLFSKKGELNFIEWQIS